MNNNELIKQPDGKYKIGNYYAYPIYSFTMNWDQLRPDNKVVKNATHFFMMFKEEQIPEALQSIITNCAKGYTDKYTIIGEISNSVKLHMYETWSLRWFNHWTFDIGQTDEEARDSFEQYVQRHEEYQRDYESVNREGRICLMGAEDRHRWRGGSEEDDYDNIPCRCKACKENGVLFINH